MLFFLEGPVLVQLSCYFFISGVFFCCLSFVFYLKIKLFLFVLTFDFFSFLFFYVQT